MDEREDNAAANGEGSPEPEPAGERCPVCGHINPPEADVCGECGQRLLPTEIRYGSREEAFGVERRPLPPTEEALGDTTVKPVKDKPAEEPDKSSPEGGTSVEGKAQELDESEFRYFFASPQATLLLQPAGLMRRAGALFFDWILAILLSVTVLYGAGAGEELAELATVFSMESLGALDLEELSAPLYNVYLAMVLLSIVVPVGMYTLFTYYGGSTPGMRFFGIQVTRVDGAALPLGTAFLRAAVLWLFVMFAWIIYLPLAALYTYLDPRGRTIHDVLCGTNVYLRGPGG
jgi:uncharacterized RDD family membrane protein YckC